jgi:hypothetical protein
MALMRVLGSIFGGGGLGLFNKGGAVEGFASGGSVPGPSVHRDVVPSMLTPGEFVVRKAAVDKYGLSLLSAINSLKLPGSISRGISSSSITRIGSGFATGGAVNGTGGAGTAIAPAVLVANEQQMETLLAGGRSAMLRFMRSNRSEVSAALNS